MFQVSGFLDHRTWSVARKTFAKSVMKTSRSIARQKHELAGHHEGRPQNCSADLVDDPRQNALVDRPSLLDQRDDVRPPGFGQEGTRDALGQIGRGADGDAHFS